MRAILTLFVAAATIITTASPAHAQQTAADSVNIFEHINIELLDLQKLGDQVSKRLGGETVRLSLEDCITMTLANNQTIRITRFETSLANADLLSAKGIFDPALSGTYNFSDTISPPSPLQSRFGNFDPDVTIEQANIRYQLSLQGLFTHFGTQYSVDWSLGRESGSFSPTATYNGSLTTTITQPFLRGRGTKLNKIQIQIAENGLQMSAAQIQQTTESTIGNTINAYWDLVGAIKNLDVRRQSFDNALRLVTINEQRLAIGTAAAIEVLQAKAEAASRQSDLITARTAIMDAEDTLKNFLNMSEGEIFSMNSIIPTTAPGTIGEVWDLNRSIQLALQNRPEIITAEYQLENSTLDKQSAKNDLLPQLDGQVSYGQDARELAWEDIPHGIREVQGRSWTLGVTGSIPLINRQARGAHIRSKQIERQNQLRLAQARRDVMLDVRISVRGVASSEILVESDKQARILQEANVAAEEKRLTLGVTTSQDVLDRQEDLATAQTQELQSIVGYEKALISLQVAEGTLLENLHIDWNTLE